MSKTKFNAVPALFIVANSISWFLLTLFIIIDRLSSATPFEIITLSAAYFGGLILSALIGSTILRERLKKQSYLLGWILSGGFSCLIFYFFYAQTNLGTEIILTSLLSCSIGLGIPTCLAIFADQTKTENRGRNGAVVFFVIQMLSVVIFLPLGDATIGLQFFALAIWRMLCLSALFFYKRPVKIVEERKKSLPSIIREKGFLLLFLPWFMFTLINYIETPVIELFLANGYNTYVLVTNIITSISAIGGGILCDRRGRKTAGILGLVFLGIGYAFISVFSSIWGIELTSIFFMVFDGVAWGFLYVTFIFVVWGDLSEGRNRETYYFLGGLPFLLSGLIQVLIQPYANYIYTTGISFTVASFFIFIAIVPLLYAPETLPEKAMKDRDLKSYVEKAQKIMQKEKEKEENQKSEDNSVSSEDKNGESDKEYEKARKLAEKYY